MRYLALCTDYDGTLATDGRLLPDTINALERLLASGRRLVLVTGRELDDLQKVCTRLDLFEYVVAENGALLFKPSTLSCANGVWDPSPWAASLSPRGNRTKPRSWRRSGISVSSCRSFSTRA